MYVLSSLGSSLRMTFSSSLHLPANFMMSSVLIDEQYSIVLLNHIYTMEYCSAIKNNDIMKFAGK